MGSPRFPTFRLLDIQFLGKKNPRRSFLPGGDKLFHKLACFTPPCFVSRGFCCFMQP